MRPPAAVAAAPDAAAPTDAQRFAVWRTEFRATARAAGISEATLKAALDVAEFRPRTIELDRAQPEFTRSTWDYLDSAVSATRVLRQGLMPWRGKPPLSPQPG